MLAAALASALLAAFAASSAPPPAPVGCCLGSAGSVTLSGGGAASLSPGALPTLMGASLGSDAAAGFVTVLLGVSAATSPSAGPADAAAGWIITAAPNGSQIITSWVSPRGSPPTCSRAAAPAGAYVRSFALCTGAGAFWDVPQQSFSLGPLPVTTWSGGNSSYVGVTDEGSCRAVGLSIAMSPLAAGALTLTFTASSPAPPPASWALPPAACGF